MRSPRLLAADGNGAPAPAQADGKEEKQGPFEKYSVQTRIAIFMTAWYVCSGGTLFGNKHIMATLHADPSTLALSQMTMTAAFGALKMYGPWLTGVGPVQPSPLSSQPLRSFVLDMAAVGLMRFATVMLGLLSLKYVAVSFTETIKSSAPFFTVVIARFMLKERTSPQVALSLVPVVAGLALCSATELSFNYIGFWAAVRATPPARPPLAVRAAAAHPATLAQVLNNCIDCLQNVFSKKLLSTHYNYVNLQFYTSAAALVVQLPLMLYNNLGRWMAEGSTLSLELAFSLLVNGLFFHMQARRRNSGAILRNSFLTRVFFHMQSVMAYAVMGLISPVTQSVANTLKRALLIWLSILYFGNPVTWLSALGTAVCIAGVFAYNHARRHYPWRPSPNEKEPSSLPPSPRREGEEMRALLPHHHGGAASTNGPANV